MENSSKAANASKPLHASGPVSVSPYESLMNAVHTFAEKLKEDGKQQATIESYGRDARSFVTWVHAMKFPPASVEPSTLVAFEDFLRTEKHGRENSIRRTVIGVRLFYRFLVETGFHRATPFDEVPIPERNEDLPKGLSHEQIENLFEAAQKDPSPLRSTRNLAMLSALCYEGLKASELIQLSWGDFLKGASFSSLLIKGQRHRSIILGEETAASFHAWRQSLENEWARSSESGKSPTVAPGEKIFVAFQGRDGLTLTPQMTRHGLKFVMYELGQAVGMKHLNTELLRHHAVSHLLSQGKTIEEIKAHLGLRRAGNVGKHAHAAKEFED